MTIADKLTLLGSTKTAIASAIEAKGVTVGTIPFSQYPTKISEIQSVTITEWTQALYDATYAAGPGSWVRNKVWKPMPSIAPTDQAFHGLVAVYPHDSNYLALRASGDYTVNWGDGTIENVTGGAVASHTYVYNDADLAQSNVPVSLNTITGSVLLSSNPYQVDDVVQFYDIVITTELTEGAPYYVVERDAVSFKVSATKGGAPITFFEDGTANLLPYKQAIVTVTPQAGQQLTSISLDVKHPAVGANTYSASWIDVAVSSSALTTNGLVVSGTSDIPECTKPLLERIRVLNSGGVTSFAYMCYGLPNLTVIELPTTTAVTDISFMFAGCVRLVTVPLFDTSSVTDMTGTFQVCLSLVTIPQFDTSSVTSMYLTFSGCVHLIAVPLLDTSSVGSMSTMFEQCRSLQTVPLFNTSSAFSMSYMFRRCVSLREVPLFNTANVTSMSGMFTESPLITTCPTFDMTSVTDTSGMFAQCSGLTELPPISLAGVTDVTAMFSQTKLLSIPSLDLSAATSVGSLFAGCEQLHTVGQLITPNATNTSYMFDGCINLSTAPSFNTSNVTDMSYMFYGCSSLTTVPLYNTSNVTTMDSMFEGCVSLITVPRFNTSLVYSMSSMFANCANLQIVPQLNVTAVSDFFGFAGMFSGCVSLSSILASQFTRTFSVADCRLSANALNTLYTNLPTVSGQTLTVTGNPGTTGDNPAIATGKGWTVIG